MQEARIQLHCRSFSKVISLPVLGRLGGAKKGS